MKQESWPYTFNLSWDHSFNFLSQIIKSVWLSHNFRVHRECGQGCGSCHNFWYNKSKFVKNRLELCNSFLQRFGHEVRRIFLFHFQLLQVKIIHSKLFAFRPFVVNLRKKQSVCDFMSVIDFIILSNDTLVVLWQYVLSDLFKVCSKILSKIF